MQDRWYGDNRDLVKWGTLFELARRYEAKQILQILYYRRAKIEIDGEVVEIAKEVTHHFLRDVNLIRNLKVTTQSEENLKQPHDCVCCKDQTSSIFAPGHDARVKSILLRIERGELEKSVCPEKVAPFVKWSGQWQSEGFRLTAAPVRIPGRDDVEYTGELVLSNMISVEVLDREFDDRNEYLKYVTKAINGRGVKPGIVFLDPDTGIEPPRSKSGPTHVLESELKAIWESLNESDVIVFYQHQRRIPDWKNTLQNQFASAIKVHSVKRAHAPSIASDVVFFFAQKERSCV